jgi:hypothetical protein
MEQATCPFEVRYSLISPTTRQRKRVKSHYCHSFRRQTVYGHDSRVESRGETVKRDNPEIWFEFTSIPQELKKRWPDWV